MRFGGNFENIFFLLLFCKKNLCYQNFVFMVFTIVTTFMTIVNFVLRLFVSFLLL